MRFEYWQWNRLKQAHILVAEANGEMTPDFLAMWKAMTGREVPEQ